MSGGASLLDANLMRRLDLMSVAAKSRIRGTMQGKRRSRQFGSSLEFADYRLYSPGDDTRQLDWHAYGRTGKPFIKLFLDEQELQVHLWLDASKSMDFGGLQTFSQAALTKWQYAQKLAAAIGYMSLNRYDRVAAATFTDRVSGQLQQLRGKGSAARLFEFLAGSEVGGSSDALAVFSNPAVLPKRPGMTWLFSDFLYESGVEKSLQYLLAAKQEVVVIQILSPEEADPSLSGELKLIDSETKDGKEVAVTNKALQDYRKAVAAYTASLRAFCFERGIAYSLAVTHADPADFLLGELRTTGLIR